MTEGPTHYEGWTCEGCEHLIIDNGGFYCSEIYRPDINDLETPSSCPFLKGETI